MRVLLLLALAIGLLLSTNARAKNIFDDDWTPPAVGKPTSAPSTAPVGRAPTAPPTEGSVTTAVGVSRPAAQIAGAAQANIVRNAVPDKAAQGTSRKLFKEVFARELTDRSPMGRRLLAERLLAESRKAKDAPSDQFVLLMGATEAAREAADLALGFKAIDSLSAAFDVDATRTKADTAMAMTGRAAAAVANLENVRSVVQVMQDLVEQEELAAAARLGSMYRAAAIAAKADDPATFQRFEVLTRYADALRTASSAVAKDQEKLKATPDDPAPNLSIGRYLCLLRGDWEHGLPLVARGPPGSPLRALALADLAAPADAPARAALGDRWWDAAAREPVAMNKRAMHQRAAYWYEQAAPDLTALRSTLAEQRLSEYHKVDEAELPWVRSPLGGLGAAVLRLAAADAWKPVEFTVTEGKAYRIVAHGQWTDSRGIRCGPDGTCPKPQLTPEGPLRSMSNEDMIAHYVGQFPRASLVAHIGSENWSIFVGSEVTFLAPASGQLSLCMIEPKGAPAQSVPTGSLDVAIAPVAAPHWVDANGDATIRCRIDVHDILHFTPEGVYWQYGGDWARVGEHGGHYPTIINGICWWPRWADRNHTEVLKTPDLALRSIVQVSSYECENGTVTLIKSTPSDAAIEFHKGQGGGSDPYSCVVHIAK